jgi:polysaccharide chain length determinant protein (PEP-CTERM system associated)
MDLNHEISRIIGHALDMWRFRWIALAAAWITALAGWTWVFMLPSVYESHAKVYVNTETALRPLLEGLAPPQDTMGQVTLVTRAMLSRPQLETVAKSTGLEARARSKEALDRMLEKLRTQIQIAKGSGDQIYSISYSDNDPNMARDVVETLLDSFVESSLGAATTDSARAQKFLEEQIKVYESRLTEAEDRLATFKKANVAVMPNASGGYFENLKLLQAEAQAIQGRVEALEGRRNELQRQLSGEEPSFGIGADSQTGKRSSVDGAIANMERQLAELRLKLTDKHPDIVRVQATLNDLYKVRDEEARADPSGTSAGQTPSVKLNPVYQNIRIALSTADADLAGLRAQLREKNDNAARLRKMVDTVPEVEAQLNRLNRDYSVVKTEYESLLKRLESAKLGDEAQESNREGKFRVIEPPRAALYPSAPNRPTLYGFAFAFALAVGMGIAFLLSQKDPTFFSGVALRAATGLPVYGNIGLAAAARVHTRTWWFELSAGGLLVAYLIVMAFGQANFLIRGLPHP